MRYFPSVGAVREAGFAPLGSGLYLNKTAAAGGGGGARRVTHPIWELRAAEDGDGFLLVRKREEREVDLRRTAAPTRYDRPGGPSTGPGGRGRGLDTEVEWPIPVSPSGYPEDESEWETDIPDTRVLPGREDVEWASDPEWGEPTERPRPMSEFPTEESDEVPWAPAIYEPMREWPGEWEDDEGGRHGAVDPLPPDDEAQTSWGPGAYGQWPRGHWAPGNVTEPGVPTELDPSEFETELPTPELVDEDAELERMVTPEDRERALRELGEAGWRRGSILEAVERAIEPRSGLGAWWLRREAARAAEGSEDEDDGERTGAGRAARSRPQDRRQEHLERRVRRRCQERLARTPE